MTYFLVPHQVTRSTATVWVAAVDEDPHLRTVDLDYQGSGGGVVRLDASEWETWESYRAGDAASYPFLDRQLDRLLPTSPPIVRTLCFQRIEIGPLETRQPYYLRLLVDGEPASPEGGPSEGQVTTLPTTLPTSEERPFTLLLGSCFYGPQDPEGWVGRTYRRIPKDARPDVKFLCGDQVYLDNPWRETTLNWLGGNKRPGLFRATLFEKYLDNWGQAPVDDAGFGRLLRDGANYFCCDDHEFWNNAPNFGGVGLANTLTKGQRRWWFKEARLLFRAFQSPSSLMTFDVPPVSFCVADTRINRDAGGERFMNDDDLDAAGRWIGGLQGPGVLMLGQPILVEKSGVVRSLLKKGLKEVLWSYVDKDLVDYPQYEDLVRHIESSKHSVVVLTGDVHFGRVAYGGLKPGSESKLVEVISSPMRAVLDDRGEELFGKYRTAPTNRFAGLESIEVAQEQNHFVTVEFFGVQDGAVNMRVRSWPIQPSEEEDLAEPTEVFSTTLP